MAISNLSGFKTCSLCKTVKLLENFSVHRQKSDGLSSWCKPCAVAKSQSYKCSPEAKAKKKIYDAARVVRLKDKLKEQYLARYEITKPQKIAAAKAWSEKNPEKRSAISQSYKHRRRSAERSGVTGTQFNEWKKAAPKVCYWCRTCCKKSPVVDHYVPLAKGGKHELGNLVISCRRCNATKSAKDPYDFAKTVGRLF